MAHRFLLLLLLSLSVWGCEGDPEGDDTNNNGADPCGGACPAEQCVLGACVTPNNGLPDADNDAPGDADDAEEPDAQPDAPDADDANDVPDADANDASDADDVDVDAPDAGDANDVDAAPDADPDMETPPEGCFNDNDCLQGQICDTSLQPNTCREGCRIDSNCLQGQICDDDALTCRIGCRRSADCPDGQACQRDTDTCVPGECGEDNDCPPEQFCDTDATEPVCLPGCRVGECPEGFFCDLDARECLVGCVSDDACEEGQYCELSVNDCVSGCRGDQECDVLERCLRLPLDDAPEVMRQQCAVPTCQGDNDCPQGFFCEPPGLGDTRFCLPGCRDQPGACPDEQFCDVSTRQCRAEGCLVDADCPAERYCDADLGACMEGCRDLTGACALGEFCDTQTRACSCALGICPSGLVCEADNQRCQPSCVGREGRCLEGTACAPDTGLCIPSCDADTDCDAAEFCNNLLTPPQCEAGCRAGGCPQGQVCDLATRSCASACDDDAQCAPDSYCDSATQLCLTGCRAQPDNCPSGFACMSVSTDDGPRQGCVDLGACAVDTDCGDEDYCADSADFPGLRLCEAGCRTAPDNCPEGRSCDPILRGCALSCEDDQGCVGSQRCLEGRCVTPGPCQGDGDCAAGTFCDTALLQPVCRPGCRAAPNLCPQGERCDTLTRACAAPCAQDGDCGQGLRCDLQSNLCLPLCTADPECGPTGLCQEVQGRRLCQDFGACEGDETCPADAFCNQDLSNCARGCRLEPGACPDGQACAPDTRACELFECNFQSQCPEPLICTPELQLGGRCSNERSLCADTFDCRPGMICQEEARICQLPCTQDADCAQGASCDINEGQCRATCAQDSDCAQGERCLPDGDGFRCLTPVSCDRDADCPDGRWCAPPELSGEARGLCLLGCRATPDSCGDGLTCDRATRQCGAAPCAANQDCPDGSACVQTRSGALCREGCRVAGDCPEGDVCLPGQGLCSCLNSACPEGQACNALGECELTCQGDADCAGDARCDLPTGRCLSACQDDLLCQTRSAAQACDPDRLLCDAARCEQPQDCLDGFYCDGGQAPARCALGCDVGTCPQGARCDLDTRACVPLCQRNADCPDGQICLREDNRCVPSCANNDACAPPQLCVTVQTVEGLGQSCVAIEGACAADADCPADQFCDLDALTCAPGCRTSPDSCAPGTGCDPTTRACRATCDGDDCPDGQGCSPTLRLCLDTCGDSQDCPQGQACVLPEAVCAAPCAGNDDCPLGQICGVGPTTEGAAPRCVTLDGLCGTDADCAPNEFCDLNDGLCAPGCRPDSCGALATCDLDTRACLRAPCDETPCPDGLLCLPQGQALACSPTCFEDDNCALRCDGDAGRCACDDDDDCAGPLRCFGGLCELPCQSDLACLPSERCLPAGHCGPACEDDAFEPNNDPTAPSTLTPGDYRDLQLCNTQGLPFQNRDCYRLQAQRDQTLDVTMDSQGALGLVLYNDEGFELTRSDFPGGFERLNFTASQGGALVLCVEPSFPGFNATYRLDVSLF